MIWSEGSAQATWATGLLGLNHTVLDRELAVWRNVAIAREEGLLQADRTVTDSRINEYHVWPSSAATSWAIITAEGLPD